MKIIGHSNERVRLRKLSDSKQALPNLLFIGPESVGKSLIAREFALHLLHQDMKEAHEELPLDIKRLAPETTMKRGVLRKKRIGVEEVRESLRFLKLSSGGGYRVLIIEDAHLLSGGAQNMLLKFVEEPGEKRLIIFVTHNRQALLNTLLSRLLEIRFSFVPEAVLMQEGQDLGMVVSDVLPEFFFRLGRPGILLEALREPERFARKKAFLTKLYRLSALSLKERLALAEELSQDVSTTIQLFEWFLPGLYARTKTLHESQQTQKHLLFLERVEETMRALQQPSVQARLVLEECFLTLG